MAKSGQPRGGGADQAVRLIALYQKLGLRNARELGNGTPASGSMINELTGGIGADTVIDAGGVNAMHAYQDPTDKQAKQQAEEFERERNRAGAGIAAGLVAVSESHRTCSMGAHNLRSQNYALSSYRLRQRVPPGRDQIQRSAQGEVWQSPSAVVDVAA